MSLLTGISQASQCEIIFDTVDPSLDNLVIYLPFMVYRIINADRVVPRGVEAAMGYKELAIVTMKKTCKKKQTEDN